MIHSLACVMPDAIGEGTRVWQRSIVLAGAIVSLDCNPNARSMVEGGAGADAIVPAGAPVTGNPARVA